MDEKSIDESALISPVPDRLDLLNNSLTNKQLLCIEYVCEFGLGINKEQVTDAKDQWGKLIFNVLYNVLSQQFNDAPSLLRLILSRLRYSTRDEHIKTNILRRLPIMKKSDKEAIYKNFDRIQRRRNHVTLSSFGAHEESLNNVLKWFRECGLKYPKEIVNYQKRHNIQVPTHWEIRCKRTCCLSFCLSIVAIVTFIPILILLTLPNYPHVTINDTYSQNHSVGVRTVVKIGEVYRSNVVKKLQIEALQNANGFYANGTVIYQIQENGFNVSSKELQHVNHAFTFTDERPIFLRYYDVSSPLYNANGTGVVNFSFNLTNSNGGDCAVRMATFSSHDDFINYIHARPYKLPSDIPQNAYNFTPCLNESGTYNFSLNMKRDAFSFFVISHIMNVDLTVNISGYISEYLIHDQESSCILSPSCPPIIISDQECTNNADGDDSIDDRWYIFGTSSSSFRGEVNLTVYPLCDKDYKNQYLAAGIVPGGVLFLLLVVCGLSCLVCSCISVSRNAKKPRQTRNRSNEESGSLNQAV
ncbi:PREDICTED: uncharacterized protein LOC109585855 [Amphimedon queenslandica]|uniref:Uncharacterized protein n=1 Tax=Amphimedon queenslandica TaxID=400682 RepID=A0AAN0JLC5_AMPQE|nr:PREDICTED: uncharacterized protein LOC109585855 [Amphimedon queenslandica]|eukprot:XP_019857560.1 PREDICTED: uncharacterized protein LOC109585855 [Amphimedon queenslandica]